MKNTLKKLLAVALLAALSSSSLPAQTNPSATVILSAKDTVEIEKAKIAADAEVAKQKLEIEKAVTVNSREAEKTEALNKQDAEKSMVKNREDACKMMVHDLAWNSWVLAVLGGILLCGIFKTRRNKQMQETVRLMVEKGSPVTPEIITALKSKDKSRPRVDPYGYLAWGLILVAVGSGLLVMHVRAGWIVMLIGGAFLILWIVERLSSNSGQSK